MSFLSYIFKIVFSIVLGYLIGVEFDRDKSDDSSQIAFQCLFLSFISTALIGVMIRIDNNLLNETNILAFSIATFSLFFLSTYFIRNLDYNLSIKLIFSVVNGVILGLGFIVTSIIITVLFIYIINNTDILSDLFKKKIDIDDIAKKENIDINIDQFSVDDDSEI